MQREHLIKWIWGRLGILDREENDIGGYVARNQIVSGRSGFLLYRVNIKIKMYPLNQIVLPLKEKLFTYIY